MPSRNSGFAQTFATARASMSAEGPASGPTSQTPSKSTKIRPDVQARNGRLQTHDRLLQIVAMIAGLFDPVALEGRQGQRGPQSLRRSATGDRRSALVHSGPPSRQIG